MSESKAKAIKIIEQFPEEHMKYVLKNLESLQEQFKPVSVEEKQKALARIRQIISENPVKISPDFDYKKELQDYRDKRYGIA